MRTLVLCALVPCALAASLASLCAQNPTIHPDCHKSWTQKQWTDHWSTYCTWFPLTPGCSNGNTATSEGQLSGVETANVMGLDDDGLGIPAAPKPKTTQAPLLALPPVGSKVDPQGNLDFTLYSGPWNPAVVDLTPRAREDVKWLNPHVITHKYVQVMMDCSQWNPPAETCNTRGMLKFISRAHQVIATSDAAHMCDSRRRNDWINTYIVKLPKGTANIIAFAEGENGKQCGPVYFTTKLLTQAKFDGSPNMFTLPAGPGAASRREQAIKPGDNTLTAELVCADKMLTLPTWCRKSGELSILDSAGKELAVPQLKGKRCDSEDKTVSKVLFSMDLPLGAKSLAMAAKKTDNDKQDCGRVRFLVRTWRDPNKTDPPTPAPTPAPTPLRAACSHLKCTWTGSYIHVLHQTKEWGSRHRCERDESAPTGCSCRCYA